MSIFGKLLSRRDPKEERARADDLYARGELGLAKLAYERALDAARGEPSAVRDELQARVDDCRDGIARARLREADELEQRGAHDLALQEVLGALETAASPTLVREIQRRLDAAERKDAREKATLVEEDDDARFEAIAGSWEPAQYDEYAAHGEDLHDALLRLYEGDAKTARPVLEALLTDTPEPCYLLFEVGRARLLDGDVEPGREALRRFVEQLQEGEGGEARLVAHMELAACERERGDFEAASSEYAAAVEALPGDPRPYLAMAVFFRTEGHAEEAVEVLTSAISVLDAAERPFRITLELGLAHAALGHDAVATELLEEVVGTLTARQHLDLPPECAIALAQLHERSGNKPRALDLYNLLSHGSDVSNHFAYHRKAASLMAELGHARDARRMLQRALELAPEDPAVRAEVEAELAKLE
jgi:tetratricopeptide (TPR) repeat protein